MPDVETTTVEMPQGDSKWWLESKTVQNAGLAAIPTLIVVLRLFHVDITEGELGMIVTAVVGVIGAIGTIGTVIGRFKANKPLRTAK